MDNKNKRKNMIPVQHAFEPVRQLLWYAVTSAGEKSFKFISVISVTIDGCTVPELFKKRTFN